MSSAAEVQLLIVRGHLDLYSRQAGEAAWKTARDIVQRCRDLEDLIAMGLSLFENLRRSAIDAQDRVARGEMTYDPALSRAFADAYETWLRPCGVVESAIRWFESRGYSVENAAQFREAVLAIRLHAFDIDDVLQSFAEMQAGQGIPLAGAIDELRGRREP